MVFDARCDWIALVEGDSGKLKLTTTKSRDGEMGEVGKWRIVAKSFPGGSFPTLVERKAPKDGRGRPKDPENQAREADVLRVLWQRGNAGWKSSERSLADELRITKTGVHRCIQTLRKNGLVDPDLLALTEDGIRSAEARFGGGQ